MLSVLLEKDLKFCTQKNLWIIRNVYCKPILCKKFLTENSLFFDIKAINEPKNTIICNKFFGFILLNRELIWNTSQEYLRISLIIL
jgi:hypothetical protein